MAKILGFNQAVADKQGAIKKAQQRTASIKRATRNIHMVKDSGPLTHRPLATLRGEMVLKGMVTV